ncbi:MAG: transcriptional regulator [Nocardiopsaceae bacterium]|jgi:predicted ArsR family transcriptional regulator|nr:transcriptional regulator [Nocardiopsaceae bacterium]
MQQNVAMNRDEQRHALVYGLDDPVRRRLYDYVAGSAEPVGRDEAAAAVGIGRPLAAYHLDRLVSLGLLTADYRRPPGRTGPGAGRPAKVYARSATEFAVTAPPREYELAARLLAEAVESDASGFSLACLKRAARRLGTEIGRGPAGQPQRRGHGPRPAVHGSTGQDAMRAVLTEHGFEPFTDADGSMALRNCPFHQLAERHREIVCTMNLALLEGVTAGIGARDVRPELEPVQGRCCVVMRLGRDLNPPTDGAP